MGLFGLPRHARICRGSVDFRLAFGSDAFCVCLPVGVWLIVGCNVLSVFGFGLGVLCWFVVVVCYLVLGALVWVGCFVFGVGVYSCLVVSAYFVLVLIWCFCASV